MNYNNLITAYRNGDEGALNEICSAFMPLIEKKADELWNMLENPHQFNCRCLMKLRRAASKHDPAKGDFGALAAFTIKEVFADYVKRRKKRNDALLSSLASYDEDGKETPFEIADVSHDPGTVSNEDESLNEKITLLAKGDSRKEIILNGWSNGLDDSHLSRVLAHELGGKSESHRKFIQRFKQQCYDRLASEVPLKPFSAQPEK